MASYDCNIKSCEECPSNEDKKSTSKSTPAPPKAPHHLDRKCLLETKCDPKSDKPMHQLTGATNCVQADKPSPNSRAMMAATCDSELPPCYMPQPNDDIPSEDMTEPMGPIGPWATGRVDWSPLAGLTGVRPVVDHYSITRFSTNEWRQRNFEQLMRDTETFNNSMKVENDAKNTMTRTFALTDQTQADSTNRLLMRSADINKWKNTLERAINAMADEISTLEEQRARLKQSLSVLRTPQAIATECLDRRCGRPDTELVRDNPEEELIKEISMMAEMQARFNQTLNDITQQLVENRTARERLEYDWSDKKEASEIDAINCGLNNNSTTILFKPGAVRHLNEQSSEEYWEHFSMETLNECERTRQKSVLLRGTLDAVLLNAARDLRSQADTVERTLNARVSCMDDVRAKLENDLHDCLRNLAETEQLIDRLTRGMQNLDNCMKVAQTRLDHRNQKPRVENCRDSAQLGLFEEVGTIQNGVTAMLGQIREAEDSKKRLMNTRAELEREIMLKRRSIMLDRDRCLLLRSHFPSSAALSGYQ